MENPHSVTVQKDGQPFRYVLTEGKNIEIGPLKALDLSSLPRLSPFDRTRGMEPLMEVDFPSGTRHAIKITVVQRSKWTDSRKRATFTV
jgi:hypothetical protein